jgi:hypothetical protein
MTPAAHNIRIWMRVHQIKHTALDAASNFGSGASEPSHIEPCNGDCQKFWLGELANAVRELMQANHDARFRNLLTRYFILQARNLNPHSAITCLTRERLH